jgi:hypothetical protein
MESKHNTFIFREELNLGLDEQRQHIQLSLIVPLCISSSSITFMSALTSHRP